MVFVTRLHAAAIAAVLGISSHTAFAQTATTADKISDFLSGLGVNTHLPWKGSPYSPFTTSNGQSVFSPAKLAVIENALKYIGIFNVRDYLGDATIEQTIPKTATTPAVSVWELMHKDIGATFTFPIENTGNQVLEVIRLAPVEKTFEGPNEVDSWTGFTYVTPSGQTLHGAAAAVAVQPILYNALKASPQTAAIPLLQFSLGQLTSYPQVGPVVGNYADAGNIHIYFGTGNPPGWNKHIPTSLADAALVTPNEPIAVTETGFPTMPHDHAKMGVSQNTQSKYILNDLLDMWEYGVRSTYIYELADDTSDPGNTVYNYHFGMYNFDWTPKPAATYLHNFTQLLQDTSTQGSGYPTSLTYTITPPADAIRFRSYLFQKRDGTFIMALWNDARLADTVTQADIAVAPIPVEVDFPVPMTQIKYGDPLKSYQPISTSTSVQTTTLYVPDHPIFLFITP